MLTCRIREHGDSSEGESNNACLSLLRSIPPLGAAGPRCLPCRPKEARDPMNSGTPGPLTSGRLPFCCVGCLHEIESTCDKGIIRRLAQSLLFAPYLRSTALAFNSSFLFDMPLTLHPGHSRFLTASAHFAGPTLADWLPR